MRKTRAVLVLLALLVFTSESMAGGIRIGFSGRYISGSVSFGSYGCFSPYSYSYGYRGFGYPAYGPVYRSVSIYAPPPPPIVVPFFVPPPPEPEPFVIRDEDFPDKIVIRPGQRREEPRLQPRPDAQPKPERPIPGQPAGKFRPLQPKDRARVQPEAPKPPVPAPPKPQPGLPKKPAIPAKPELDPRAENLRQIALGRRAFGEQQYGRAERRFQTAVEVAPKEPLAHFLLAQAQLAVGKYQEAVASIHAGLRLDPDWPTLKFRPRDLYEDHAKDYDRHLATLSDALLRNQDDPVLIFLYAYQLWFDGRQVEARPLFRRAARLVAKPFFIDLFLLAQPGGPVVKKT